MERWLNVLRDVWTNSRSLFTTQIRLSTELLHLSDCVTDLNVIVSVIKPLLSIRSLSQLKC